MTLYELDFDGMMAALEALLKADSRLDGVTITQEDDELSSETCPGVFIDLTSASHTPTQLVAMVQAGVSDKVDVQFDLHCMAFSAQSQKDAKRQRNELVRKVIDVIRDNATVGGFLLNCGPVRLTFSRAKAENSIFMSAVITVTGLTMA